MYIEKTFTNTQKKNLQTFKQNRYFLDILNILQKFYILNVLNARLNSICIVPLTIYNKI